VAVVLGAALLVGLLLGGHWVYEHGSRNHRWR
jgi:hypothetical protein